MSNMFFSRIVTIVIQKALRLPTDQEETPVLGCLLKKYRISYTGSHPKNELKHIRENTDVRQTSDVS